MYSNLKKCSYFMHILFTNIHTPNLYKVKGRCNKFGYNVWTKNIHSYIHSDLFSVCTYQIAFELRD